MSEKYTKSRRRAGSHTRTKTRRKRRAGLPRGLPLLLLPVILYAAYQIGSSWARNFLPLPEPTEPEEVGEEFRPEVGEPPYSIAVDAGHGGSDTGAVGVIEERQMTARTAQLLTELLEADENYVPVTTRASYDTTAKPSERVEEANRQNADLILSIHGNSASTSAAGFECYPITPGRQNHKESMYFARLLSEGMQAAGHHLRGKGGVRYIYYGENDEKRIVEINDTSVHTETTFTILEYANCPSVLVEQCFVTSAEDVDRFGDEDGCALSARIYYEAICAYFGTQPRADG